MILAHNQTAGAKILLASYFVYIVVVFYVIFLSFQRLHDVDACSRVQTSCPVGMMKLWRVCVCVFMCRAFIDQVMVLMYGVFSVNTRPNQSTEHFG